MSFLKSKHFKNYLLICRFDHWFKNIFILPGVIAGLAFSNNEFNFFQILNLVILSFISVSLICSANYVINEYLDRSFDKFHPTKKNRPAAKGEIKLKYVLVIYVILIFLGFLLGNKFGEYFKIYLFLLLFMGILYNVKPFRLKEVVFLDVITESFNNVLRFLFGWQIILMNTIPPSSLLILFWTGGAFLMTVKRLAEYRTINDKKIAILYRKSFKFYSESKLILSSFYYAIITCFFIGIFLIKYRIEFILSFPFITALFVYYFNIGLKKNSIAQTPENLYKNIRLVLLILIIIISMSFSLLVDIPILKQLVYPSLY